MHRYPALAVIGIPPTVQDTARKIEALALAPTDPAKLAAVRASIDNYALEGRRS